MLIDNDEQLTDWIKKRITEINCDAEPVAFAKYVLALLRKDSSEEKLRENCEDQLDVFLGSSKLNSYTAINPYFQAPRSSWIVYSRFWVRVPI
jgi:hypothetical protein